MKRKFVKCNDCGYKALVNHDRNYCIKDIFGKQCNGKLEIIASGRDEVIQEKKE